MSNLEGGPAPKGDQTAVAMRESFHLPPKPLPPHLKKFLSRLLVWEIPELLEKYIDEFSPTIVNLFLAMHKNIDAVKKNGVEMQTSKDNWYIFTKDAGDDGVAKDMPPHLVPLVIAALVKLIKIDENAQINYETSANELSTLLVSLYLEIQRVALLAKKAAIDELRKQIKILTTARENLTSSSNGSEDSTRQAVITREIKGLNKRIEKIKEQIDETKTYWVKFMQSQAVLLIGGANLLNQPLTA